jgi:hypothetical protein
MYKPVFLRTENQLNKVLKQQKRSRQDLGVLFLSLWDEHSQKVLKLLKQRSDVLALDPDSTRRTTPLYVVDSFTMPHAFVIFNTTKLPHLVQFKRGNCDSEDYLSRVYRELGL